MGTTRKRPPTQSHARTTFSFIQAVLTKEIPIPMPRLCPKTRQLLRIEFRRRWLTGTILPALGLVSFLAFEFWSHSVYGWDYGRLKDHTRFLAFVLCGLSALVFGSEAFLAKEKDGIRSFLYHHPISRVRMYVIRYLAGAALVIIVSSFMVFPALFVGDGWRRLVSLTWLTNPELHLVVCFYLLVYTTAVFFSPLFAMSLTTIATAVIYIAVFYQIGLVFAVLNVVADEVAMCRALILASLAIFTCGLMMFRRRRILECSWPQRSGLAFLFFIGTAGAMLTVTFVRLVNVVDLLYLLGIDLAALGG